MLKSKLNSLSPFFSTKQTNRVLQSNSDSNITYSHNLSVPESKPMLNSFGQFFWNAQIHTMSTQNTQSLSSKSVPHSLFIVSAQQGKPIMKTDVKNVGLKSTTDETIKALDEVLNRIRSRKSSAEQNSRLPQMTQRRRMSTSEALHSALLLVNAVVPYETDEPQTFRRPCIISNIDDFGARATCSRRRFAVSNARELFDEDSEDEFAEPQ